MPGKDFEQQVRETMGPWRLEPSGEVWGRLEAGLQRKKKRRRAFYIFLLAGLLTGAALLRVGLVGTGNGDSSLPGTMATQEPVDAGATPPGTIATQEPANAGATPPGTIATQEPANAGAILPGTIARQEPVDAGATPNSGFAHDRTQPHSKSAGDDAEPGTLVPAANGFVRAAPTKEQRAWQSSKASSGTAASAGEADRVAKGKGNPVETHAGYPGAMESPTHDRLPMALIQPVPRDHRFREHPYPTGALPMGNEQYASPWTSQQAKASGADDQAEKYTRKKILRFGIEAGVGRTAYSEGLNMSTAKAADLQSGPATGSGSGTPQRASYEYRQDPSTGWTLGAWMTLPISRRWSFTTGLSYLQYSTRTPVGPWAGDSVFGYFNGRSIQYSNTSYQPGNQEEHRNRYHLLQVPVAFSWQLNKGEKVPISWTIGLTPGYLLSSNALVQDSSQAMYHHPDNQRRFQLGFRTGILFRLMPTSTHPLELGPVMQYQLNEVFTNAIQQNGHLYYLGLEARLPIFSLTKKQR
ncbi:MAG: outer membrane beta-barrel protein [Chitinophagaceae bacterium]|nr:outer membrane beta-barrel protein [Chitinophagaceae bacterium]